MSIIAYSLPNTSEPLNHLLYSNPKVTSRDLRVLWDLDGTIHRILTGLPDIKPGEKGTNRYYWGNYRLYYIPSKMFAINKNGTEAAFYDLSQYYPGEPEPRTLSGVQEKAGQLMEVLASLGIPEPKSLTSPVAVWEQTGGLVDYESNGGKIPTIWQAPDNVLQMYEWSYACSGREWVSNCQIGADNLYSYDICSAYPYEASRLIDLRDCRYYKLDTYDESAYYGILYGDLYIDPSHPFAFCSPVLSRLPDGTLSNPVGNLPSDFYPLDLIRFIDRYGIGKFNHKLGWYVKPWNGVRPRFPFRVLMEQLYARRESSTGMSTEMSSLQSYFVKRVMTGIVGRLLESRRDSNGNVTRYGDMYNPLYHDIILSRTAIRVAEFIISKGISQSELVHVGVDGIKTTRYIPLSTQSRFGQWRYAGCEPTIIISPAGIYTPTRSPQSVPLPILRAMLEASPQSKRYEFDGWELDLPTLHIKQNRHYDKMPKTGGSLLSDNFVSEPITL